MRLAAWLLVWGVCLAACGDDDSGGIDASSPDGGSDAGVDGGSDAGVDAGSDASTEEATTCVEECTRDSDCTVMGEERNFTCEAGRCRVVCTPESCLAGRSWREDCAVDADCSHLRGDETCIETGVGPRCALLPDPVDGCPDHNTLIDRMRSIDGSEIEVCGRPSFCNELGQCITRCTRTGCIGEGTVCNPETERCDCVTDESCPDGRGCQDGTCSVCRTDSGCFTGVCGDDGRCVCTATSCATGWTCGASGECRCTDAPGACDAFGGTCNEATGVCDCMRDDECSSRSFSRFDGTEFVCGAF